MIYIEKDIKYKFKIKCHGNFVFENFAFDIEGKNDNEF